MTGNQKLHALAQDQLIAHAFAIAITRIHQGLQQILAGRFVATLFDVFEQNGVGTGSHLFMLAQLAGGGKPGIQIGLKSLPNNELLDGTDGMADKVDVLVLQPGAKERSGDHREGNFHQVGVDIDGAATNLAVEIPEGLGYRVLHDRGQRIELLSIEAFLDETSLRAPGFSVGRKKTLSQKVPHPLYLNFRFSVVFRIGLQHVLNDSRIDGNNRLLEATQIEPEGVAEGVVVPAQDLNGVAGHGARIRHGANPGDDGDRRG